MDALPVVTGGPLAGAAPHASPPMATHVIMAGVDTVEWGTGERPESTRGRFQWRPGWVERPLAAGLAGLAVLALVFSQLLPWGYLTLDTPVGSSEQEKLYLDNVGTIAVFAFQLGLLPLLALAGAALAAPQAARRTLAAAGIGAVGCVA